MSNQTSQNDPRPLYAMQGNYNVGSGSNSNTLAPICRKLWVGSSGTVVIRTLDSTTCALGNVPAGYMLDGIQFDQVLATGTTAGLMIAFW